MSEDSIIIQVFGASPQMRIVDFFLEFPTNEFTINEIVENVGMSKTTATKYVEALNQQELIKTTKKIGKTQPYTINMKNPVIQMIKNAVGIMSDKVADNQLSDEKLLMKIRKSAVTSESLMSRKKLLQTELKYTNEHLKTIPAQ
ncbi:winged helix-turn-helix domain-containing protein [Nitrosopumilus ureiphilus]|uniref:Uncharacterized protein n=1 Tax=Nitrosopumilus ureiphilus TaxID=1470067 RepID=A0A7D5R7Z3_9ARCH|nr:winged helix-turn-helix domain-containing protein [Nitrosopumilus ureiphilus]QLH07139.1 hypothetical protein C5F50_08675 [Nitrosopumilus ureiphilus]